MRAGEEAPGGPEPLLSPGRLLPHYYLIVRCGEKGLEFPHMFLNFGEEVLPMFSSIQAAQEFLARADLGEGWCVREFFGGELAPMICALCVGITRVLLDPLSEYLSAEAPVSFAGRDSFMDFLVWSGREKGGAAVDPAGMIRAASG